MYSEIALKICVALKQAKIKSRKEFWKKYNDISYWQNIDISILNEEKYYKNSNINLICVFDNFFPCVNPQVNLEEQPFLFAYIGDINLLNAFDKNIAVIGVLNPTEDVFIREKRIVETLVLNGQNIISGLAKGCDSIAHKICVDNDGKTIAFLPSTLENIYPKTNIYLSNEIIKKGELIITEYVNEVTNKFEQIKRFIERDRLQVMFAKAVVLIASFVRGEGDSGSRYAMAKAKQYGFVKRYVMFNDKVDNGNKMFGLNKTMILEKAKIITEKSIKELIKYNL